MKFDRSAMLFTGLGFSGRQVFLLFIWRGKPHTIDCDTLPFLPAHDHARIWAIAMLWCRIEMLYDSRET